MKRIVDLLHGQEELRYCSALAIILAHETGDRPILRRLLRRALNKWWTKANDSQKGAWGGKNEQPFNEEALAEKEPLKKISVQVEEPVQGKRGKEGRIDLSIRFNVGEQRYLFAIEAKVGAVGTHDEQMTTYRQQFDAWDEAKSEKDGEQHRLFGMLTVGPPEDFQWYAASRDDDALQADKAMVDFWLRWEDIHDVIKDVLEDREDCENRSILKSFLNSVRTWTMSLSEFREAMELDHPPFLWFWTRSRNTSKS